LSYDETKKGFRSIVHNFGVLSPFQAAIDAATFDYVDVNYADSTTEIYTLVNGGATGVAALTFTVVYEDASKTEVTSILKA